ncbi:hypothetical protein [Rickettsia fournieri]|nr:hypothetical protein [Rickettsia fournieri]
MTGTKAEPIYIIDERMNNEAQSSNQFTIELSKRRMNGSEGGI